MRVSAIVNLEDLRRLARRRLPKIVFDYIDGGAEDELGMVRNRRSFERLQLVPRILADISARSQSVELFGRRYACPFGIAPTGLAGFARPGADLALAAAAAEADIPFVLSGAGTASLEAAVGVAPQHTWFQLYVAREQRITEDLMHRARDAGVEVLMLTVDVPVLGKRERDLRNGLTTPPRPSLHCLLDMLCHPRWLAGILRHGAPRFENWAPYLPANTGARALSEFFASQIPFVQTWRDLERIRTLWPGRLVVKGCLAPADAVRLVDCGADGIVVSNHGGRQLDAAPAALAMLPSVAAAVGARTTVMLDSGVRRGADVLKAFALGARFVFVGRPTLYGVAADGRAGAAQAIGILRTEVDLGLAMTGLPSPAALTPDDLVADTTPADLHGPCPPLASGSASRTAASYDTHI